MRVQEASMSNEKQKRRPHEREVEVWARALGVSPQRLIALVEEVAKEQLSAAVPGAPAKAPVGQ
jgi:hypothetical protein